MLKLAHEIRVALPHCHQVSSPLRSAALIDIALATLQVLDPFRCLTLWIYEQGPIDGSGGDDGVLNGERIRGQALHHPPTNKDGLTQKLL